MTAALLALTLLVGQASSQTEGVATYCAPTPRYCQSWGNGAMLGAVPGFRDGDKPYWVTVHHQGRSVRVKVVSFCACGYRNGVPTVIDLSPAAFSQLAPLSKGVITVTVTSTSRIRLPATDTLTPIPLEQSLALVR